MCGIFYFQTSSRISLPQLKTLQENCLLTSHRGPDKSVFIKDDTRAWGFHRLSINGMDPAADQPFYMKNCRLICNGEIYNFRQLIADYGLEAEYKSGSDCEIIIHLYRKIGIVDTIEQLDGVFGFVLHDYETGATYIARDPVGVRSLYIGVSRHDGRFGGEHSDLACVSLNPDHYALCIASEMKSIHSICDTIVQFPPGCYMEYLGGDSSDGTALFRSYYDNAIIHIDTDRSLNKAAANISLLESQLKELRVKYFYQVKDTGFSGGKGGDNDDDAYEREICANIRELFNNAVVKRLMSERPVGCLLSGGLDSSLVTAIVSRRIEPYCTRYHPEYV